MNVDVKGENEAKWSRIARILHTAVAQLLWHFGVFKALEAL